MGLRAPDTNERRDQDDHQVHSSIVTLCKCIHTFFSVSLWPQLHCSLGRESAIVSRVRAINLPPKVIVVELKNLPVSSCYIDNKESLELGLWLSGIMVQRGGMVEWLMSLGLQIRASPTWPWTSTVQCMGLVYPIYNGNQKEYFNERFSKGICTKGQLYNTHSMDIISVPLFFQLFQNFQKSGLRQDENFYSKCLKKNTANRNPRAGIYHPCEDN